MELSQFENGIVLHNNVIKGVIEDDGLYVMHEHGYSYTVGMRDIGVPELVIYGQRSAEVAEMFSIIYTAATPMVGEPDMNEIVKNVFDPPPELTALPEREKRTLFYAARTYYDDWIFSALKITMTSTKCDH